MISFAKSSCQEEQKCFAAKITPVEFSRITQKNDTMTRAGLASTSCRNPSQALLIYSEVGLQCEMKIYRVNRGDRDGAREKIGSATRKCH